MTKKDNVINNKQIKFITKASIVHNNFYKYDKVIYIHSTAKVIITCPEHGDFEQRPADHLQKHGCPKCGGYERLTTETFITKASTVHNNFYKYDKVIFTNSNKNVIITCPEHGDFEQRASSHLCGRGCPKCFACRISKKVYSPELDIIFNSEIDAAKYINSYQSLISMCLRGKYKSAGKHPETGCKLTWKYI